MTIEVTLPYPPSANRYWRVYRNQVTVSKAAENYKEQVAWIMNAKQIEPLAGDVKVSIDIYRPQKSGDTDNFLKVALDSLNKRAYADDKQVVEIHARRFDDKHNPRLEVRIEVVS